MNNYVKITTEKLTEIIMKLPIETTIDFSEYYDEDIDSKPEGWYGIKRTHIFDEEGFGVIVIGYYGGGCTKAIDISDYGNTFSSEIFDLINNYFENELRDYDKTGIWIEVTEEIKDYIQ